MALRAAAARVESSVTAASEREVRMPSITVKTRRATKRVRLVFITGGRGYVSSGHAYERNAGPLGLTAVRMNPTLGECQGTIPHRLRDFIVLKTPCAVQRHAGFVPHNRISHLWVVPTQLANLSAILLRAPRE